MEQNLPAYIIDVFMKISGSKLRYKIFVVILSAYHFDLDGCVRVLESARALNGT